MKDSSIQLDDLPDEILLYIFKKLDKVDLLYSIIGVNQRFNTIVHDPKFTNHLRLLLHDPEEDACRSLPNPILDRYCSKILPEIGHQVKSLHVEPTSMERILQAPNYPNLSDLGLCDMDIKRARSFLNDENSLVHSLKNQISSISINFIGEEELNEMTNGYTLIFMDLLTIFTSLQRLIFNPSRCWSEALRFDKASAVMSSTLTELHVSLEEFIDCLNLLDGRFDQLRILYANIALTETDPSTVCNKKIPNLQIFSLYCNLVVDDYENSIVALLQRMINLEELNLTILFVNNDKCIDTKVLNNDIVSHMLRLHQFTFNIYSTIHHFNPNQLILYEYNQHISEDFYYNQVITCVEHFPEKEYTQCRIYSYPYRLKFYNDVTNTFPGGSFKDVTKVSLYDEHPFEYEFFVRIAESFPFIRELSVRNQKAQNDKQFIKSKDGNQRLSVVGYPNLSKLNLMESHDDYVELFLLDTKVYLSISIRLFAYYESVQRVTWNFTRNETRNNCAKISSLDLFRMGRVTELMKDYFPGISTD